MSIWTSSCRSGDPNWCALGCTLVWGNKAALRQWRASVPEGRRIAFWWVVIDIINNDCDLHFAGVTAAGTVLHPDYQWYVRLEPQRKGISIDSPSHLQHSSCWTESSQKLDVHHGGKWKTLVVYMQEDRADQQRGSTIKSLLFHANHGWFSYF